MTNIDLNQISIFVAVVESGSFSAAGELLSMPRSTVSRKVTLLESALGVRLLNRSTRKLSLTDTGEQYFHQCRIAIEQIGEAGESVRQARISPSGTLRISAPLAAQQGFMCDWINEYAARYPDVTVDVMLSDDFIDMIDARIDIAFRAGKLDDATTVAQRLGESDQILCAHPEYIAQHAEVHSPKSLSEHRCIVFGQPGYRTQWRLFEQSGRGKQKGVTIPVSARVHVNSMEFAVQSCLAGLGIALLPRTMAKQHIEQGSLVHVLPSYSTAVGGIYIVYPSRKLKSASAKVFIELVLDKARNGIPM